MITIATFIVLAYWRLDKEDGPGAVAAAVMLAALALCWEIGFWATTFTP